MGNGLTRGRARGTRHLRLLTAALVLLLARLASAACFLALGSGTLNFGNYDPLVVNATMPLDVNGTVSYLCLPAAPVTISLSRGLYAASFTPRLMAFGTERLQYNLYLDATRSAIWGDGTGGTHVYSNATPSFFVNVPVYGRVFAGQDPAVATSYSDTVTVTLNF